MYPLIIINVQSHFNFLTTDCYRARLNSSLRLNVFDCVCIFKFFWSLLFSLPFLTRVEKKLNCRFFDQFNYLKLNKIIKQFNKINKYLSFSLKCFPFHEYYKRDEKYFNGTLKMMGPNIHPQKISKSPK